MQNDLLGGKQRLALTRQVEKYDHTVAGRNSSNRSLSVFIDPSLRLNEADAIA